MQIFNIIEGWAKYLTGETDPEAIRRAKICRDCPHAEGGTFLDWLPEKGLEEVKGLKCGICTCPLVAKIRSTNETCPISKW